MQEWIEKIIEWMNRFYLQAISSINREWVFYVFRALGTSKNAFWECADPQHFLSVASA
jgi:hypothetical protein